jgi:hypothetical protein
MSITGEKRRETEKIRVLAEQLLQKELTFLQFSNHWVFEGTGVVVKCSDETLDYEMEIAYYCHKHGMPALTERADYDFGGYKFYVYQRGDDKLNHADVTHFLGSSLARLHQLPVPETPKLKTHREETELCLSDWRAGYSLLRPQTVDKIEQLVQRSLDVPGSHITHGDPIYSNVVRLDKVLYLIDWEHASVGPKEIDLAVLKYVECFGESTSSFEAIASSYGPYNEEYLDILLDGRVASSLAWYAHNVLAGHFERNDEIDKRAAWLDGDHSIVFTKAV